MRLHPQSNQSTSFKKFQRPQAADPNDPPLGALLIFVLLKNPLHLSAYT